MQSNRGKNTGPEVRLRQQLHSLGLRYRVGLRVEPDLRRTVDVAFTKLKLAVFIDGCFWHGCPLHSRPTKTNSEFWAAKISTNKARDADTNNALGLRGWKVVRFWEHEDSSKAALIVEDLVKAMRATS
jgi:DNA mismatch endonuclease (patch repair protein)